MKKILASVALSAALTGCMTPRAVNEQIVQAEFESKMEETVRGNLAAVLDLIQSNPNLAPNFPPYHLVTRVEVVRKLGPTEYDGYWYEFEVWFGAYEPGWETARVEKRRVKLAVSESLFGIGFDEKREFFLDGRPTHD